MQIFEDAQQHCYGFTERSGPLPTRISYGPYIQLSGTHKDCHTFKLRSADKFSEHPAKETTVITLERRPLKGDPYYLRFVLPDTTQEQEGEDLARWLLEQVRGQQRRVMRRMGRPEDDIDPLYNSASTSIDGAGSLLKAIRKWMVTDYGKPSECTQTLAILL